MFDGTHNRDTGVEKFILRHRSTLRQLHLNMCSMYLGQLPVVTSARWADFWRKLEECPHLEEISVRHRRDEYVISDSTSDPIFRFWFPPDLEIQFREEDKPAFEHLMAITGRHTGVIQNYY